MHRSSYFLSTNRCADRWQGLKARGNATNDLVLVAESLSSKELEDCGGISYVVSLLDGVPRIANLNHYADIIRQLAVVRRNLSLCDLMGANWLQQTGTLRKC